MIEPTPSKIPPLRKFAVTAPAALVVVLNLFLFAPLTIYTGNVDEFGFAFFSITATYLSSAVILFAGIAGIGALLPPTSHRRYTCAVFALGILIWIQGNVILWEYGVLGKGEIDWSIGIWRGWVDAALWVTGLICAVVFSYPLYRVVTSTSILIICLQAVLAGYTFVQHPALLEDRTVAGRAPRQIYEYSAGQNVIHVILDELQADVFHKIVESDAERYGKAFDGFTFYQEASSPFPTTLMSVPAYLSGEIYRTPAIIQDFVDGIHKGNTIPNLLFQRGYQVDLAAEQAWYGYGRHTNWFQIPVPYGVAAGDYKQANADYMLTLSLFRMAPHFLKQALLSEGFDLPLFNLKEKRNYEALRHFSHKAFLQDVIDSATIGRDGPLYKLLHFTTTHWPTVLDGNCEYAGEILPFSWENIEVQAKCSLDHFLAFLEKLKTLGVYDSALIIIHADHGYWEIEHSLDQMQLTNLDKSIEADFHDKEDFAQKVCASSPLLAIKLPHQKGRMTRSDAQVSIADIPATLNSYLKLDGQFSGRSILDASSEATRERKHFYYYKLNQRGDKYFDRIDEYSITGKLRDRQSWRFVTLHLPPGTMGASNAIALGTESAGRFLRYGWSVREVAPDNEGMRYNWALGNAAAIYSSLPKTEVKLTVSVKCPFPIDEQEVTVVVDGKEIGSWKNSKQWEWEQQSLVIQADDQRPDLSSIEFRFSKFKPPDEKDYRELALLFEMISFETVTSD